MSDDTICNLGCLYKTKSTPCMVLTEHGRLHAIKENRCMMFNDGHLPNQAHCKQKQK